jgi:hypothetical protein
VGFANLSMSHEIRSNTESGYGRADILLKPKTKALPRAFIIELKALGPKQDLDEGVRRAFMQIEERAYETQLLQAGVQAADICKLAIVIQGKQVKVAEWRSFASQPKPRGAQRSSKKKPAKKKSSRSKRSSSKLR